MRVSPHCCITCGASQLGRCQICVCDSFVTNDSILVRLLTTDAASRSDYWITRRAAT